MMGDEKPKGALGVVAEQLAKPVYEDGLQPLTREAGQTLAAAGSFVRLAVRPFQSLALGLHLAFDWLDEAVRNKFEGVPAEKIVEPPANVAGPLMLAAGFTSEKDRHLRALYAQLLATAMHADTRESTHPAFVEILRQLSSEEAAMLKPLAQRIVHPLLFVSARRKGATSSSNRLVGFRVTLLGNEAPADALGSQSAAIGNLERLGLVHVDLTKTIRDSSRYDELLKLRTTQNFLRGKIDTDDGMEADIVKAVLVVTELGAHFLHACLGDAGAAVATGL
jgi:hypothetical protein